VFDVSFLERMLGRDDALPFHRANKKVPHVDEQGRLVDPTEANAIKFERFIFDLLPMAKNALAVEGAKQDAFAPVKNADGEESDTPASARELMIAQHTRWLREAGAQIDDGVAVEINPRFALDVQELAARLEPGLHVREPTYFYYELRLGGWVAGWLGSSAASPQQIARIAAISRDNDRSVDQSPRYGPRDRSAIGTSRETHEPETTQDVNCPATKGRP
jgi:hypothetical protein